MAQNRIVISTPRGQIIQTTNKGGGSTAKLEWNKGFGNQKTKQFSAAQKFVDSECLRRCEPYVPFLSGAMAHSGQLGTEIGSGLLRYIVRYAHRRYLNCRTNGQRGPRFFERMKAAHRDQILKATKEKFGE